MNYKLEILKILSENNVSDRLLYFMVILAYNESTVKNASIVDDINTLLDIINDIKPINFDSAKLFISEYQNSNNGIKFIREKDGIEMFGISTEVINAMAEATKLPTERLKALFNLLVAYINKRM